MADDPTFCSGRFTLTNKHGIHVRTAALIAECCEAYEASITITTSVGSSEGTDMMRLMMLQASQGTELSIEAEGPDAIEAIQALEMLITKGFDSSEE